MKKLIAAPCILAIILSTVLSGCFISSSTLKLGAILPMEGDALTSGNSAKNGIELAIDQYNNSGKPIKKIEFTYYNGADNTPKSQSATKNLIADNKADVIIGGLNSASALGIAPVVANNSKLIFISPTASSPAITNAGSNIFMAMPSEIFQGEVIAKFASKDLKMTKVAIMINTDDKTGFEIADKFKATFLAAGGTISQAYGYKSTDTDFNQLLIEVGKTSPDAIFIADFDVIRVSTLITQAFTLGLKTKYLSTDTIEDAIRNVDPKCYDDVYYPSLYSTVDSRIELQDFIRNYQTKYDALPDLYAAYSYDTANLLIDTINVAGGLNDTTAILKLLSSNKFKGVTGEFKFDSERHASKQLLIFRIKEGKPHLFTSFDPENK